MFSIPCLFISFRQRAPAEMWVMTKAKATVLMREGPDTESEMRLFAQSR